MSEPTSIPPALPDEVLDAVMASRSRLPDFEAGFTVVVRSDGQYGVFSDDRPKLEKGLDDKSCPIDQEAPDEASLEEFISMAAGRLMMEPYGERPDCGVDVCCLLMFMLTYARRSIERDAFISEVYLVDLDGRAISSYAMVPRDAKKLN